MGIKECVIWLAVLLPLYILYIFLHWRLIESKKSAPAEQSRELSNVIPSVADPVGSWDIWDESIHRFEGQAGRMQRSLMQGLRIEKQNFLGRYEVCGSKGDIYSVGYESCTCKDFERRHLPCKHMYLVAMETLKFDPVPYIILIHMQPHPLRGYMNLGRYRVKGVHPDSGRTTTKNVYAPNEEAAILSVRTSTILEGPFSAVEVAYQNPSEEDIATAKSLGVYVPDGAKGPDVKASILRYKNYCETTIEEGQWKYAAQLGVQLSALSGEEEGRDKFRKIHKRWYPEEQAKQRIEN